MQAALRALRRAAGGGLRFRHVLSGGEYVLHPIVPLQEATVQPLIVYECVRSGQVWARPALEFFDGRFELVAGDARREERLRCAARLYAWRERRREEENAAHAEVIGAADAVADADAAHAIGAAPRRAGPLHAYADYVAAARDMNTH